MAAATRAMSSLGLSRAASSGWNSVSMKLVSMSPLMNLALRMTRAWKGMVVLMPFTEYSARARLMRVRQRSRVLPQTTSLDSRGS